MPETRTSNSFVCDSPLLEQRYGAQTRRYQMRMGFADEIKHFVLQVLRDADHALTTHEIAEKVEILLPEDITQQMNCAPHYLSTHDLVEGALTVLYLNDHKVGTKEVYFPLHPHDA
ncbi:MAG: hypothetical protein Q8R36_04400 [bacterium]|nr:hypothetical protein [bacterium]